MASVAVSGSSNILGILLGVSSVDVLGLLLEGILGQVGLLVPGVVLSGTVDLGELLLVGANLVGGVGSGVASNVAEEDGGVLDWVSLASGKRSAVEKR